MANAKIETTGTKWYVHYTPNVEQQVMVSDKFLSTAPTDLFTERYVLMKEVNAKSLWTFELGAGSGIDVPISIIVRFQQRDRDNSAKLNNNTFYRPLVSSAKCITGTESILVLV